jgi:archaellum component FlaG (FlaF/FlaG flagellin family)
MRRVLWIVFVVALIVSAFVAGGFAAAKSYQFTGVVKAVDAGTVTVEKSAKETWQFDVSKDTKGTPKVGDKVTVYYRMVATEIEAKAAASPTAAKKSPAAAKKK